MRISFRAGVAAVAVLGTVSPALAAPIILDDFETGEGRFSSNPPATSGSNRNIGTGTTADRTETTAHTGIASEQVFVDALEQDGSLGQNGIGGDPTSGWRLRFLSGGGSPANNVNIGPDGYVGYFLKTTTPGLQASIILDDLPGPVGTAGDHEIANYQNIIADGQFHLYQFNLDDAAGFSRFAGSVTGPGIDGQNVSIDALVVRYEPTENRPDATLFFDTVAFNTTGDLSSLIPEPASFSLLAIGGCGLLARRRRV